MKLTKTCLSLSTMAAMLIGFAGSALADSTPKNLTVQATVLGSCDINVTKNIDFGTYDPVSGVAATGDGTITVRCTEKSAAVLSLSMGDHEASGVRSMAYDGNSLPYRLFKDSALNSEWVSGTTDEWTAGKALRTISVFGQIPAGTNVPAGIYTDTVVASIQF